MAVKDYREMLISSIITLAKKENIKKLLELFYQTYLLMNWMNLPINYKLSRDDIKWLTLKKSVNCYFAFFPN